jgi:hypothetical protein
VAYGSIFPWNLNLASLTASDVLGKISITRTVKNVGSAAANFVASVNLPGWSVSVVPASLSLNPGDSASFTVNLTRSSAAIGAWSFGNLVWSDGVRTVRSPVSVRGTLFSAPAQVDDTRVAGNKVFTVGSGYDGSLFASATGLVPATLNAGAVATSAKQCFNVVVPAGALLARFQLFNSDTQGGSSSDLDLEVHAGAGGAGALVGSSGGGTSDEKVDLKAPAAGTYSACVIGYAPVGGNASFKLSSWVVGPAVGTQTLKAAAASKVTLGGTASVAVNWSAATAGRYLGMVQFKDGNSTPLGSTLVSVDTH